MNNLPPDYNYLTEDHLSECEEQPEEKDCICPELKQEKYDEMINNQIDDLFIDLL